MAEQPSPESGESAGLRGWLRERLEKLVSAGPVDRPKIRAWNRQVERFLDRGLLVWALEHAQGTHECAKDALGADDPATWESRELLGACLYAMGRESEALIHHEAVLEARRRVADSSDRYVWTTENNLGVALLALKREDEALSRFQSAVDVMCHVLESGDSRVIAVQANLADCLSQLGRTEEALAVLDAALVSLEPKKAPTPSMPYEYHVADGLLRNGGLTVSRRLRQAIGAEIRREACACEAPRIVVTTGGGRLVFGPFAMQEAGITKSVVGAVKFPESWIDERAVTLKACKALCLMRANRPADALAFYREVLYHSERRRGHEHPQTSQRRNQYGECLMVLHEWEKALSYLKSALVEQRMLLGDDHPSSVETWINHATVLENLGQPDEAVADWRCIANALRANLQPGGVWLKNLEAAWRALDRQARAGRLPDWPELFQGLSGSVMEVIDLLDADQWYVARGPVAGFHAAYLELTLYLDRLDLVPGALAGVQGRKLAALVRDELDRRAKQEGPKSPAGEYWTLRLKLRRLALGIDGSRGSVQPNHENAWQGRTTGASDARDQYRDYRKALEDYRDSRRKLAKQYPWLLDPIDNFTPTLATLREKLAPNAALVFLLTRPEETEAVRVTAVVIRTTAGAIVPLGVWGKCVKISKPEAPSNDWYVEPEECWEHVFDERLWAPLAVHLTTASAVHLVTQGVLHDLPYDLGCPKSVRVAVFPGLVYFDRLDWSGSDQGFSTDRAIACLTHGAEETSEPISLVDAERTVLKTLWPEKKVVDSLGRGDDRCAWHLAGHGHFDPQHPTLAEVLLEPKAPFGFHEIMAFPKVPPLVFLSACKVGRTQEDAQEGEPLGLVGALLLRGARFVVGAVHDVPDLAMPILVTLFYQAWRTAGFAPADALAEAKRRILSGDWYADTESLLGSSYRGVLTQLAGSDDVAALFSLVYSWQCEQEILSASLRGQIKKIVKKIGWKREELNQMAAEPSNTAEIRRIRARLADERKRDALVDELVERCRTQSDKLTDVEELVRAVRGCGWGWTAKPGDA